MTRSQCGLLNAAYVLADRLGRTEDALRLLGQVVSHYPRNVRARANRDTFTARRNSPAKCSPGKAEAKPYDTLIGCV